MKPSPVPANAKVAVVIGTHASLAYCELGITCLRKHEPNVAILLHDDSSPKEAELRALAKKWGTDFVTTDHHKAETVGDLSAFSEGLKWASNKGDDILVKVSRRFILDKPWSADLTAIMHNSGYPTACAPCAHYNFGYRSELVGMHVKSWIDSGVMEEMQGYVDRNHPYGFPEGFHHEKARQVLNFVHPIAGSNIMDTSREDCNWTLRSEQFYGRPANYNAYVWWMAIMGLARHQIMPNIIWHDSHVPSQYYELSQAYGLKWTLEDFLLQPRQ